MTTERLAEVKAWIDSHDESDLEAELLAEVERLRGLVIRLREYGCCCDLMNGVRCGIHSIS